MLRLNVTLSAASPQNAENLLEGLEYQAPSTRLEHGCLGCGAWLGADSTVRYCEDWATEDDLRRRVQSERFTSLLAVVEAATDAEVEFHIVNQTRGLDYVVELREQAAPDPLPLPPRHSSEPER
jgi:quinol monooxygenase YgiN